MKTSRPKTSCNLLLPACYPVLTSACISIFHFAWQVDMASLVTSADRAAFGKTAISLAHQHQKASSGVEVGSTATAKTKADGSRGNTPLLLHERLHTGRQGGVFARKRVESEHEDDDALQQARVRAEKLEKRAEANSRRLSAIFNRWCGEEPEEGFAEDDDEDSGEGSGGGVAAVTWRGLGMETVASFVLQVRRE